MKDYTLYIFDFDNTLFDTSFGIKVILDHALPSVGATYDDSRFLEFAGLTMEQVFDRFGKDESQREEFYRRFTEAVHSDVYLSSEPFPETARVLRELKGRGKRIAIASGKFRYKIVNLMEKAGLSDVPEAIVGYHETERHKPYPDPIVKAMSFFDVPREETVYIGDCPHDAVAAEAAGIDSVIVNRHNGLTADGTPCTWEIDSLDGLLDVRLGSGSSGAREPRRRARIPPWRPW